MGRGRIKLKPLGKPPVKTPASSSSSVGSGDSATPAPAPVPAPTVAATGKRKASDSTQDHPTQDGALLISRYHALLKYVAQAKVDPTLSAVARASRVKDLERQIADLGGIEGMLLFKPSHIH
jgi:hypothetical protein